MKNQESRFVEEIIRSFHSRRYPKKVVQNFHLWLLASQDYTIKDNAMNEVWQSTPYSVTRSTYRSLENVKRRLGMILSNNVKAIPLRRVAMRVAAVLLPAVVMAGAFFIVRASLNNVELARLEVPNGETAHKVLSDGTEVWLNAGSWLEYPEKFKGRRREVRLYGEGFFDVTENSRKPFTVYTRNTRTEVVGTEFNISCYDNLTRETVTVLEGHVDVTTNDSDRVHSLEPDRQFYHDRQNGKTEVNEVDAASLIRWMDDGLVFENSTFEDILAALQRKYDFEVVVDSVHFTGARYRMQFVNGESLEYILDVVHSLVGLPYGFDGRTLTVGSDMVRKNSGRR